MRRGSRLRQEEEERRGGEEQATDIKSNNPHLAGGEKRGQENKEKNKKELHLC